MAHTDEVCRAWSRRLLAVLMVAPLACTAPSASADPIGTTSQPIVGGVVSGPEQDAVVFVAHATTTSNDVEICSGTLLAPRLVLTARHCVAPVDRIVACRSDGTAASGGRVGTDYAPTDIFVFAGSERPNVATTLSLAIPGAKIIDDGSPTLCNHDLALVLLDREVPGATIAPVRLENTTRAGEVTTIVGWGLDDTDALPRTRRQRAGEAILAVGPSPNDGIASAELLIGKGACEGDSGGPAFAESGAVVGVLSRGGSSSGVSPPGTCASDDVGVYTAPAGFSELVLSAYDQAGQGPWLEGQPSPASAQQDVITPSGGGAADSGGGGCAMARRREGAELFAFVIAMAIWRRTRRRASSGPRAT